MDNHIESILNEMKEIFIKTDEILEDKASNNNIQVHELVHELGINFDLEDKDKKRLDPVIRLYLHKHPKFTIKPGAHGGISLKNKPKTQKVSNETKEEVMKKIMDKIADKMSESEKIA